MGSGSGRWWAAERNFKSVLVLSILIDDLKTVPGVLMSW